MIKRLIKSVLAYHPHPETEAVRQFLDTVREPGLPFCPPWEGDLIHRLITRNKLARCLEIGFGTGSTAVYMLDAVEGMAGAEVTSIDLGGDSMNDLGQRNLARHRHGAPHTLLLENSNTAVPRLFAEGRRFDFIYVDGWKTFDHLAMEMYFLARMLVPGGFVVFDDTYVDGMVKVVALAKAFYGFSEIDYADAYGEDFRLRLWLTLTHRRTRRLYRALRKPAEIDTLPVATDWTFHRSF